jgi:DNA-directed RNA polymerase specialized sigma24 family protein
VEIEPDIDRTMSASDELLALVEEAFQARVMSAQGRRLILTYRVYGIPTRLTAAAEGRPAGTVRQYRNRAEVALAKYASG